MKLVSTSVATSQKSCDQEETFLIPRSTVCKNKKPAHAGENRLVVRVAGLEPAWAHHPRDFKSLASTISPNPREEDFNTFQNWEEPPNTKKRLAHCQALPHLLSIEEMVPRVRLELTTP